MNHHDDTHLTEKSPLEEKSETRSSMSKLSSLSRQSSSTRMQTVQDLERLNAQNQKTEPVQLIETKVHHDQEPARPRQSQTHDHVTAVSSHVKSEEGDSAPILPTRRVSMRSSVARPSNIHVIMEDECEPPSESTQEERYLPPQQSQHTKPTKHLLEPIVSNTLKVLDEDIAPTIWKSSNLLNAKAPIIEVHAAVPKAHPNYEVLAEAKKLAKNPNVYVLATVRYKI